MLEITHSEFSNASAEAVWGYWSNPDTWAEWDKGVEWCRLEEGETFKTGAKAVLQPRGAPGSVEMVITECEENRVFVDEAKTDLGLIKLSHFIEEKEGGVLITHTMQIFPHNEQAKAIFEQHLFPKMKVELPESVKTLARMAEQRCAAV